MNVLHKGDQRPGSHITFGTLRYGKLLEAVLYDCRRYVDYKGDHAKVIPQWAEDWVIARTRAEDTAHLLHVLSLVMRGRPANSAIGIRICLTINQESSSSTSRKRDGSKDGLRSISD